MCRNPNHHHACPDHGGARTNPFCHDKRCDGCLAAVVPVRSADAENDGCFACDRCGYAACAECARKIGASGSDSRGACPRPECG